MMKTKFIKNKADKILEVIKNIPCEKLMLNQLVKEINNNMPQQDRMSPRGIAFLVSAMSRENKLFVCKEVISCHKYYTIQINDAEQNEKEVNIQTTE